MSVKSKLLFVLIGDDRTGKTTLQKLLIHKLYGLSYERLPTNLQFELQYPEIKRKYQTISFGNRSYQEKREDYGTVMEYFQNHFQSSDIAFISSHLVEADAREMIAQGRQRFYNVIGVFWSNSIQNHPVQNAQISLLDWNERLFVENPPTTDKNQMEKQLSNIADSILLYLINRTSLP